MASQLYQTIDQLSREKGIEPEIIVSAIEDAMAVATRKYYKSSEELKAEFNKETGEIEVFALKTAVETVTDPLKEISLEEGRAIDPHLEPDGEVRIKKATDVLGRIAAQTAKQVICQKVREAERDTVYNEYSGRVGELVNCTVKRIEGPDLIVGLGKTEARLPRREQSRLEQFSPADRLRAIIVKVEKSLKGPQVIISRAAPDLVTRLFAQEVPEIYDGTVVIKACAREAGERTKISVISNDRDVDPTGACVGMKGMRVESVRRELRGEKIDIVQHSEDHVVFATKALQPAKVSRVSVLDPVGKHLEVIVDDTQLSLAIGKKGQNVRLAAKLMGWRIDIKSEEEKRLEVEWEMGQLVGGTPMDQLSTLSERLREKLVQHDITSIEQLGSKTPEQLQEISGIGPKMVEKIRAAVQNYWEGTGEAAEGVESVELAEASGDAELAEGAPQELVETPAEPAAATAAESAEQLVPLGGEPAQRDPTGESEPPAQGGEAAQDSPERVARENDHPAAESLEQPEPEGFVAGGRDDAAEAPEK